MYLARRKDRSWLSLIRPATWVGAALLLVVFAAPVWGQEPAATTPGKLTAKEARDAKVAADAEKLYQMALDLKVEVDKSNKDTVSLSIVKRAAEIEKLAKILKQETRSE